MSAALSKAIKRAKDLLKERQKEKASLSPITIQFGGQYIPAPIGQVALYFKVREAAREIKITRGTEPLHSINNSARLI